VLVGELDPAGPSEFRDCMIGEVISCVAPDRPFRDLIVLTRTVIKQDILAAPITKLVFTGSVHALTSLTQPDISI
jgi:hypothetical protein